MNLSQKIISEVFCNPIVTKVSKLNKFYIAENDHQKYLGNNTEGYNCHYFRKRE
ncbi:MAG: peptide-methionine (S)-S-oxide reductase [Candidatus Midichloriaceae bacterium]